ncbi:hypothetical protein DERP_003064 [Dermatophagoides pteronyssinus]|uniref:Uncharacterized protein n=1 Tax=Dermatophagoides pteronyssinus TaxID=6956 RepID=A0ABQ8JIX7_DERPT|nr:hypothetical protein DERP_003064 [Dermatophagoides pteronyssinus]
MLNDIQMLNCNNNNNKNYCMLLARLATADFLVTFITLVDSLVLIVCIAFLTAGFLEATIAATRIPIRNRTIITGIIICIFLFNFDSNGSMVVVVLITTIGSCLVSYTYNRVQHLPYLNCDYNNNNNNDYNNRSTTTNKKIIHRFYLEVLKKNSIPLKVNIIPPIIIIKITLITVASSPNIRYALCSY